MFQTYFKHNELPGCEFCGGELCRLSDGHFDSDEWQCDECGEVYNKRQLLEINDDMDDYYEYYN